MSIPPEQKLKRLIKAYLTEVNAFWSCVQGGAFSKPGDPDIICCYKGLFIGIEAKTKTGKVSEIQKLRHKQIAESGGIVVVARSVDDVREVIESIDRARAMAVWDNEDRQV